MNQLKQNTTINSDIPSAVNSVPHGLLPCYALIFIGLFLTGFMPWFLVCLSLYKRNKHRACYIALAVNVLFFILLFFFNSGNTLRWWNAILVDRFLHLIWAIAASVTQRKILGKAERQFDFSQWKRMITPIIAGVLICTCGGIVISQPSIIQERDMVISSIDILDRSSILLEFFKYTFIGAPFGLLLGLWWSRRATTFSPSIIISVLCGSCIGMVIWFLIFSMINFYLHRGYWGEYSGQHYNALIPPWQKGFPGLVDYVTNIMDILSIIVFGLFFGSIRRIRDFWKFSLLTLLVFIFFIPSFPIDTSIRQMFHDQLLYDMDDPNPRIQARAYKKAGILLQRYPDYQKWPSLANSCARYYYDNDQIEEARELYQTIVNKYESSNRWYWVTLLAKDILKREAFGIKDDKKTLSIPVVDYESYLDGDWMALLSAIKYWEVDSITESSIKMRLYRLSKSDDKIELKNLNSLIDFDDAVQGLGYHAHFMQTTLTKIKKLLDAGFPVIYRSYTYDRLLFGYDNNKGVMYGLSFSALSSRLKKETRKETDEMTSQSKEGEGKSKKRLERIANEAFLELNLKLFEEPYCSYFSPIMFVVCPPQKHQALQQVLALDSLQFARQNKGYRSALIALEYLDKTDLLNALEWAQVAASHLDDPLPYFIGYLASQSWNTRKHIIKNVLPLDRQIKELSDFTQKFTDAQKQYFLKISAPIFESAFKNNTLPYIILSRYDNMLEISNPAELEKSMHILEYESELNPSWSANWRALIHAYEMTSNTEGIYTALQGLISDSRYAYHDKTRLAKMMINKNEIEEARKVLATVVVDSVKYNADYYYCLAALAEDEGKTTLADKYYKKCTSMRRYRSEYFWKYGSLLAKSNKKSEARKVLTWAAQIDTATALVKEKKNLLDKVLWDESK